MPLANRIKSKVRGNYLRTRLNEIGKSQRQLSEYMGVSPGRVATILDGDDMLISEMLNICRFCYITPVDLIENTPELINDVDPDNLMTIATHIVALPDGAAEAVELLLKALWENKYGGKHCGCPHEPAPLLPPIRKPEGALADT